MKVKKIAKFILCLFTVLFILLNIVAYSNAYKFTHFSADMQQDTVIVEISFFHKLDMILFGINIPKPINTKDPKRSYETIRLKSNKELECWYIPVDSAKATVILFHGYHGSKEDMLDRAELFSQMGYNTFLVDFMGSGNSEGTQTTIGYYEAENVKSAYDYIKEQSKDEKIVLMGTSMGAAAMLKAENDYNIKADALIIECPYGTMLQTVSVRFELMGIPAFPMAHILTFWGGVQNKFDAFSLKPAEYAKKISTPTLLIYGEKDPKVARSETDKIFNNLEGIKYLKTYPLATHADYLELYKEDWTSDTKSFLEKHL